MADWLLTWRLMACQLSIVFVLIMLCVFSKCETTWQLDHVTLSWYLDMICHCHKRQAQNIIYIIHNIQYISYTFMYVCHFDLPNSSPFTHSRINQVYQGLFVLVAAGRARVRVIVYVYWRLVACGASSCVGTIVIQCISQTASLLSHSLIPPKCLVLNWLTDWLLILIQWSGISMSILWWIGGTFW